MWLDVVLELVGAALDVLFSGGWKGRRERRRQRKLEKEQRRNGEVVTAADAAGEDA